jgi:uncharacterized protein (DUF924 family)
MDPRIDEIIGFWFGGSPEDPRAIESRSPAWFRSDPCFDEEIRARFGADHDAASRGERDPWRATERGSLALILVLDQFSRNLHRGTPRAFAQDGQAQAVCLDGLDRGSDRVLPTLARAFFYLPLHHAEDSLLQDRCVEEFRRLLAETPPVFAKIIGAFSDYAEGHWDVVRRFGRFPHRNAILGRESTAEEQAYLHAGAPSYGQTVSR